MNKQSTHTFIPNQKVITINKAAANKENIYGTCNKEANLKAMRLLGYSAYMIYMYINLNNDGFEFGLSKADALTKTAIKASAYNGAIRKLIDCGYLENIDGNQYIFHEETPCIEKQYTPLLKNNTPSIEKQYTPLLKNNTPSIEKQYTGVLKNNRERIQDNTDNTEDNTANDNSCSFADKSEDKTKVTELEPPLNNQKDNEQDDSASGSFTADDEALFQSYYQMNSQDVIEQLNNIGANTYGVKAKQLLTLIRIGKASPVGLSDDALYISKLITRNDYLILKDGHITSQYLYDGEDIGKRVAMAILRFCSGCGISSDKKNELANNIIGKSFDLQVNTDDVIAALAPSFGVGYGDFEKCKKTIDNRLSAKTESAKANNDIAITANNIKVAWIDSGEEELPF